MLTILQNFVFFVANTWRNKLECLSLQAFIAEVDLSGAQRKTFYIRNLQMFVIS